MDPVEPRTTSDDSNTQSPEPTSQYQGEMVIPHDDVTVSPLMMPNLSAGSENTPDREGISATNPTLEVAAPEPAHAENAFAYEPMAEPQTQTAPQYAPPVPPMPYTPAGNENASNFTASFDATPVPEFAAPTPVDLSNYGVPASAEANAAYPEQLVGVSPSMQPAAAQSQAFMNSAPQAEVVPAPLPQFGGPMAELPPLVSANTQAAVRQKHHHWLRWSMLALFMLLIGAAAYIGVPLYRASHNVSTQQTAVTTAAGQLKNLGKNSAILGPANIATIDKTSAFYAIFKNAAEQQVVQTTRDAYYTNKPTNGRPAQYNMVSSTFDYRSKAFAFDENSYAGSSLYQTRCVGGKEYTYDNASIFGTPAWHEASDNSACTFSAISPYANDGLNTGGLSGSQVTTFIRGLLVSKVITVNDMSVVTQKNKQYLRFDVDIQPHKQSDKTVQGLQAFLTSFQKTGLNAKTYPYQIDGSGSKGAHLVYYVDPSTQLPVYAQITSQLAVDSSKSIVAATSYSHQFIEYAFPQSVTAEALDAHAPITFTTWPEQ